MCRGVLEIFTTTILGWGISHCYRAGHKGHCGPSAGPGCLPAQPRVAGPPGPRPTGTTRRSGGAIRLAGQGAPRVPGPPRHGSPATRRCVAPPKTLGARPPLALGPKGSEPRKQPKPDLPPDQGGEEEGPAYAFTLPWPKSGTETRGTLCDSPSQATRLETPQQCPLG